jgi:hypothetical protein
MTELKSCFYLVVDLDLTAGGYPGLSYTGTLQIEPDDSLSGEDWYIYKAWTKGNLAYGKNFLPEIFAAICKAVDKNRDIEEDIWRMVRGEE